MNTFFFYVVSTIWTTHSGTGNQRNRRKKRKSQRTKRGMVTVQGGLWMREFLAEGIPEHPHSMNTTTRKRQASGKEKKNLDTSTPIYSMQKDNVLPDGISMTKQEEQGHDINKQHGVIVGTRKRENLTTTFKNVKDTKLHTAKIKKWTSGRRSKQKGNMRAPPYYPSIFTHTQVTMDLTPTTLFLHQPNIAT